MEFLSNMKLEKILKKIEEDTEKEIRDLKESHAQRIKKIDEEREKLLNERKEEKERLLTRERNLLLEEHKKEVKFSFKMSLLKKKRSLLETAIDDAKKDIKKISSLQKKELFEKRVKRVEKILDEKCLVFISPGMKKEIGKIFRGIPEKNIIERKEEKENGFTIEGKRFILMITLENIVDEVVEKNQEIFSYILFEK